MKITELTTIDITNTYGQKCQRTQQSKNQYQAVFTKTNCNVDSL